MSCNRYVLTLGIISLQSYYQQMAILLRFMYRTLCWLVVSCNLCSHCTACNNSVSTWCLRMQLMSYLSPLFSSWKRIKLSLLRIFSLFTHLTYFSSPPLPLSCSSDVGSGGLWWQRDSTQLASPPDPPTLSFPYHHLTQTLNAVSVLPP